MKLTGGVQCWPEGHATRYPCEAEIPDTDSKTMSRYGWGWVWARDDGAASGEGPFYACPEHRSNCTEEEREIARQRNIAAITEAGRKALEGGEHG